LMIIPLFLFLWDFLLNPVVIPYAHRKIPDMVCRTEWRRAIMCKKKWRMSTGSGIILSAVYRYRI
jgi:hypothetical protein